jgi:superfamily I DNA/RNA helicase
MIINDLLHFTGRDLSLEQDMEILKNFFGRMNHIAKDMYEIFIQIQDLDEEEKIKQIEKTANKKEVKVDAVSIAKKLPSKKKFIKKLAFDNMQTDPYLNALRVKFGYAITCHKAQGSEWQSVFIHFEKSLSYLDKENLYRWTYTAISRAEKKLHLLNNQYIY